MLNTKQKATIERARKSTTRIVVEEPKGRKGQLSLQLEALKKAQAVSDRPDTRNGLPADVCVSALQKCIRRGKEREAMQFAVELALSMRSYHSMVCNRLQIICQEDIDNLSQPWIFPFVRSCCEMAKELYSPEKVDRSIMPLGNAIMAMCRAKKSRIGDHFQAVTVRPCREGFVPKIPDFAIDKHTAEGRAKRRGLTHFLEEGAKLVPKPTLPDPYEKEAYAVWRKKKRA